jgi:hypothetical protein
VPGLLARYRPKAGVQVSEDKRLEQVAWDWLTEMRLSPKYNCTELVALLRQVQREERENKRARILLREVQTLRKMNGALFDQARAAEARLREVEEALLRVLTEAGLQAHRVGCPNRLMRTRLTCSTTDPCPACDAEALVGEVK